LSDNEIPSTIDVPHSAVPDKEMLSIRDVLHPCSRYNNGAVDLPGRRYIEAKPLYVPEVDNIASLRARREQLAREIHLLTSGKPSPVSKLSPADKQSPVWSVSALSPSDGGYV